MSFGYDARNVLVTRASDIVRLAFREQDSPKNMSASLLFQEQYRSELGLEVNGAKSRVVFFDFKSDVGLRSAQREIVLAAKLLGKNLVPEIIGFADDHAFLASEWVEGKALAQLLDEDSIDTVARMLGSWAWRFFDSSVSEPCDGNWYDYLRGYEAFQDSEELDRHLDALRALTFSEKRIAQNHVRLDRYIQAEGGDLLGLDLADAAVKPPKWDLMLMAKALVQVFPSHINEIAVGLAEGWHESVGDDSKSTTYLIKLFALRSALKPLEKNRGKLSRALDNLNSWREKKVTKAFLTPHQKNKTTDLTDAERANFFDHIEKEAARAKNGDVTPVAKKSSLPASDIAVKYLNSMCATCNGFCCTPGRDRNAFITSFEILSVADKNYGGDLKAAADYYLTALPKKHVKGSCFYHTANGCALSRDARSEICNTYYCQPAKTVFSSLSRSPNKRDVLFVARDGLSNSAYVAVYEPESQEVISEHVLVETKTEIRRV